MQDWKNLLDDQVKQKGVRAVARELAISHATLIQVINGTYKASTNNVARRVMKIYGHEGGIPCPELGEIEPEVCATNYDRAKRLGRNAGNPDTVRLRHACLQCTLRGGGK